MGNGAISVEKYIEMQREEARSKAMEDIGFQIPWKHIDITEDLICDLEYLDQLSAEEQMSNPELIFQVARTEMEKTLKVVKDVDALKNWYYSELNNVPLGAQEDLGVYLGIDFSPKARRFRMEEMGLRVRPETEQRVGLWPYVKTVDKEIDFSNAKNEKDKKCFGNGKDEQNFEIER